MIKKLTPLLSSIAVIIIFALLFACNNIYPFGELSISWCDMDQQTIPLLCEFKDILSGKSDFWLSLANAGGMNFFGVYFFNLSSPFTYLIVFFEKSQMPLAVNILVLLKLALSAFTMALWLKSAVKGCNFIAVISLSVLYAFSGYAMMYYQILGWLDCYYLFPLLLLGLQNIAQKKSAVLYIVVLFLCIAMQFYIGYTIVLFICLYGAVYCLSNKSESYYFAKHFILGSAVAALLSAVVYIPCFIQYTHSMRGESVFQSLAESYFTPPIQTSLPTFFCLLIFAPFIVNLAKNRNIDFLDLLFALMLVPLVVEPVAAAWQTYSYMSFPTRYGFITIALGLTLALKGITSACEPNDEQKEDKRSYLKLFGSVVALAFCLSFAVFSNRFYDVNKEIITSYSQTLWGSNESLSLLALYYLIPFAFCVLVYLAVKFKIIHKVAVYALIAILCVVEAGFSASVYMIKPANDYPNFKRALQIENLIEDDEFYRLKVNSKYFHVNSVGAMGYNSLAHYTSLNRESYMIAMKQLGYSSYWMEVNSNGGTIFTDALLRNKYTLKSGSSNSALYSTEDYYVVQAQYLFPTAFLIDNAGDYDGDLSLERWNIQEQLFSRLTGKSGLYEGYKYTSLKSVKDEGDGKIYNFVLEDGKDKGIITYKLTVNGKKSLYFDCFNLYTNSLRENTYGSVYSIVTSRKKDGVTRTVNSQSNYPSQSKNGVLYLGEFSNCEVTVTVTISKDVTANSFGVFSVDNNLLENAVNSVIGGDFVLNRGILNGLVTASESDQALFTCLAYDEGYRATVNGKSAQTYCVNGFLALKLQKGNNEVSVRFVPKGLYLGLALFFVGCIAFLLYALYYKKINDFNKFKCATVVLPLILGSIVLLAVYLMPIAVNLLL